MVAGNDNRRVLIEILLLNPGNKLRHLFTGTMQHHSVLVIAVVLLITEFAGVSVLKMCVCCQHREVEGFSLCRNFTQTFFCKGKELFILISPPLIISFRDQTLLHCPIIVVHLIIAVLFKIRFTATELANRSDEKILLIAFVCQHISQCIDFREKAFLICHLVSPNADT